MGILSIRIITKVLPVSATHSRSNGDFIDPDLMPAPVEAGVHKCFKYLHRLFPADESCRQTTDVSVVVLTG